jgi:hypothetical protein
LAESGELLAGEGLNLKPDFEFALLRPELAHFGKRISINHSPERIRELSGVWKGLNAPRGAQSALGAAANLLAAAQQADLTALQEIGNGGCGFAGIAGAAGDGEDEIAERKL